MTKLYVEIPESWKAEKNNTLYRWADIVRLGLDRAKSLIQQEEYKRVCSELSKD